MLVNVAELFIERVVFYGESQQHRVRGEGH